jgi:aminopeptidase N
LSEYGDSVATGDDFKNSIESSTGIDFDPFFDQWYYGKGYPRFDVEYTQLNDTLFMTVNQSTSSTETPVFQLFVDFKVYFSDGDTFLRLYQSNNFETFIIPLSKTVTNIIVDPDNWILNETGTVDSVESPGNNKSLFKFSPNPVVENLNVSFNAKLYTQEKLIQIIDINGRLIRTVKTNSNFFPVNISDLSKGIYFIKGSSNNKSYTYKFIKQ